MAKIIDSRDIPDIVVDIPGIKPPVSKFEPLDGGDSCEVDAFNQMIRRLRDHNSVVPQAEQ